MNWSELTARLHADGMLDNPGIADTTPPQESGYGRWLSVVGAWFAASLLLGFIGALTGRLLESDVFCAVAGCALLAGGIVVGRNGQSRTSVMVGQFALIACVLGGILLGKAVLRPGSESYALLGLAGLCIPCLLLTFEQNQRHLFAVAGVAFLCIFFGRHQLSLIAWVISLVGLIVLFLQQERWVVRGRGELFNALIPALSLAALLTPLMLSKYGRISDLFDEAAQPSTLQVFLGSDLAWALLGALSALVTAAVGYRTGLRSLRGFALTAILGYGYMFYFSVGSTLLHKAYALLATAALLLLIRLWTRAKATAQGTAS